MNYKTEDGKMIPIAESGCKENYFKVGDYKTISNLINDLLDQLYENKLLSCKTVTCIRREEIYHSDVCPYISLLHFEIFNKE